MGRGRGHVYASPVSRKAKRVILARDGDGPRRSGPSVRGRPFTFESGRYAPSPSLARVAQPYVRTALLDTGVKRMNQDPLRRRAINVSDAAANDTVAPGSGTV
jgi:hypothetical protein